MKSNNVMFSGAARGADTMWAQFARKRGDKVMHMCFKGQLVPESELEYMFVLSDEVLKSSNSSLALASKHLNRSIPKNSYILRLLQRNYFQIAP